MSANASQRGKGHSQRASRTRKTSGREKARRSEERNGGESARAIWKGTISFGLIEIPVSITAAEQANELAFHQLDKHDHSPIGYQRINKSTGKTVAWGDIVRGYEIAKGTFVTVTDEDIANANVKATQTIDIQDFVRASEISPAFFDRPYHLVPGGRSNKAYAVLRDALAKKGLAAIALVVIRTRQHLCAIEPRGGRLELELLRFATELRPAGKSAVDAPKASPREVELAEQLIDSMVTEWNPARYKDTYTDELLRAIHEKARTGAVEARNVPARSTAAPLDLVSLLQKSLGANGGHSTKRAARSPRSSAA
jgi:DNA end-binding protein Ku